MTLLTRFIAFSVCVAMAGCTTVSKIKPSTPTKWSNDIEVGDVLVVTTSSGGIYRVRATNIEAGSFIAKDETAGKSYVFRDQQIISIKRETLSAGRSVGAVLASVTAIALVVLVVILSRVKIET